MALGVVVDQGHNALSGNVNSITLTNVNAAVGDKIVVGAGGGNSTGAVTFSTPDGNVWTTDIDGTGVPGVHQGSCDVTVAMVNQTITATWSTTVNTDYLIAAMSFSGAATGIGSATPASTTNTVAAWRGALSFTTTGASERVIQFGVRAAVTTSTPAGSNTEVHDFASAGRTMSSVYQDIAAGSVANGGTWASAGTWRACGASYAAAAGGTTPVSNTAVAPVEAAGGLAQTALDPIDAAGSVAQTAIEPINGNQAITTSVSEPLDATGGIASSTLDSIEALQGIAAGLSDPIDALGNTPVSQSLALAIESLSALNTTATAALDAGQQIGKPLQAAFEALVSALVAAGVPIESAVAIGAAVLVATTRTRSAPGSGVTRTQPGSGLTQAAGTASDTHTSLGGP